MSKPADSTSWSGSSTYDGTNISNNGVIWGNEYNVNKFVDDENWVGSQPVGGPDKLSFPIPGKLDGVKDDKKNVLELKKCSFAYPNTDVNVLENVTCRLTLGSRVWLIGKNGAGKSTLMTILWGEYNINDPTLNDASQNSDS